MQKLSVYKVQGLRYMLCSLIPAVSNGTCFMYLRGGETKRAKLNCTPLARGTIEPFVNNGFPTRSGKSLKLETLDIESRLTGLKNRWQDRRLQLLVCCQETLKAHRKTRYR